jgi:hypothetical protein
MLRSPVDRLGGSDHKLLHGLGMLIDEGLLHHIVAEHDVAENIVIGEQHPHATLGGNLAGKSALPRADGHHICLPMAQYLAEL